LQRLDDYNLPIDDSNKKVTDAIVIDISSIQASLNKLLDQNKLVTTASGKQSIVQRLHNGVHRVVQIMETSGYDDDFTFRAPIMHTYRRSQSLPINDDSIR
jgi:hypothetical protein